MYFRFKVGDKIVPINGYWRDGSKYKIVESYCNYTDTLYISGIKGFEEGFWYEKINEV
ncbi:hypothetical protein ACSXEK_15950 (plasmid) [Clostridium perfringens]